MIALAEAVSAASGAEVFGGSRMTAGAILSCPDIQLTQYLPKLGPRAPSPRAVVIHFEETITMQYLIRPGTIGLALLASAASYPVFAQTTGAAVHAALPADPWPRQIDLGAATATVYPPQVESWDGNRIRFRTAVTLTASGAGQESVGVVWASAVTHVDRTSRLVSLDDVTLSRATFPTLADGGDTYLKALQTHFELAPHSIALDRLQASLAAAPELKPRAVAVQNVPPRVFVSDSPAILVPISGPPVLRAVSGTPFERVINTRALVLRDSRNYYLHLYDGWMTADSIDGRWNPAERVPSGIDRIAGNLARSGQVDLLDGGAARPRPSLRGGAPTVFVTQAPAEIIVFDGAPDLEPIAGTAMLRASNTTANVIVDIVSGNYYVLLAGRWFRSMSLNGPWTYVAARALPGDFARIPPTEPAGAVLASVAGTPQAKEAVIENAIPQTATVPRANGPTFTPEFDGHPQHRPITGTPLAYVANSPTPVIRVAPKSYFAVEAGVWFEATSVFGPWQVATSVPEVIYSIPASSPLHHVIYVRIYSATPRAVEVGYTPGYTGTLITSEGVVVYGTGYAYAPWVGTAYYPPPVTYGVGSRRCCKPLVDATRNVYVHWGNAIDGGTRTERTHARVEDMVVNGRGNGTTFVRGRLAPESGGAIYDPRPLGEGLKAASTDSDYYAGVNGSVYRRNGGGWERQTGNGWARATTEESAWADREQQARASGLDRFQRHRERAGVDRFAEDRSGGGERGAGADPFGEGIVQVGGLRGRRGGP